eukprot:1155352-Amphidinium_carterae.1
MSLMDGMQFQLNVELVVVSVTVSVLDASANHGAANAQFCSTQRLKHDIGWASQAASSQRCVSNTPSMLLHAATKRGVDARPQIEHTLQYNSVQILQTRTKSHEAC